MKIIVEGHEIETKEIWDIRLIGDTRNVAIIIKIVGKANITISRKIPYETRSDEFQQYWAPYKKLYESVKEKWEADKTELKIFKL